MDYQLPNFVAAFREIITYHVQRSVWSEAAPEHLPPLGGCPDISASKLLAKQYNRGRLNIHSYYLNAIVQGAMEAHSLNHFKHEPCTNEVICNHCRLQIGDVSLWEHLAVICKPARDLLSTDAIALEVECAAHEARHCKWRNAYWLRGLMQPFEQDQLNLKYEYTSKLRDSRHLVVSQTCRQRQCAIVSSLSKHRCSKM